MQALIPLEKPSHDEGSKLDPEVTPSWSCSCIAQVWKASTPLEDGFGNTATFRRSCPRTLVISLALQLSTAQLCQHCYLLGWGKGNITHVINSGRLCSQATSKPYQFCSVGRMLTEMRMSGAAVPSQLWPRPLPMESISAVLEGTVLQHGRHSTDTSMWLQSSALTSLHSPWAITWTWWSDAPSSVCSRVQ